MSDETIAVSLRLGPRLLARVDMCARERGIPRAEFIRAALDESCTRSEAQAARRERLERKAKELSGFRRERVLRELERDKQGGGGT